MIQYYQVDIFTPAGEFIREDIERMLDKGRKNFFIYFPRVNKLEEILKLIDVVSRYKDIKFCIHDKTLLNQENEIFLGRNLTFYYMVVKSGIVIENISFHLGSLFGFGGKAKTQVITDIINLKVKKENEQERFYCSLFDEASYRSFFDSALSYVANIVKIAQENNIRILIKNLCLDYIFVDSAHFDYFENLGYHIEVINENLGTIPAMMEMGDFPRHVKEMYNLDHTCNVGISLDMEFLRYLVIVSRRYNIENKDMVKKWGITLNAANKKMLDRYGFLLEKGKPVFYEKELDFYEQIFYFQDRVEIAHLTGSIGPIFVDDDDLDEGQVDNDFLLGLLPKELRGKATQGRRQLSSFNGVNEFENIRNFKCDSSQELWEKIFKKQFLEDVFLLKEIGCSRVVQKMKAVSENAVQTFNLFNDITSMDID